MIRCERPLRFLRGRPVLSSVLSRNERLRGRFEALYGALLTLFATTTASAATAFVSRSRSVPSVRASTWRAGGSQGTVAP